MSGKRFFTFEMIVEDGLRMHAAEGVGHDEGVHVPVGWISSTDVEQHVDLGAGAVDGEEGDVEPELFGGERRLDGGLLRPVDRLAVGLFDEERVAGDLEGRAFAARLLGHFDVGGHAAAEGEDLGAEVRSTMALTASRVALRYGRHAGLDPVDAQLRQLLGDRYLVVAGRRPGRSAARPRGG